MHAGGREDVERCATANVAQFAVILLTSSKPLRIGCSKRVSLDAPGKGFGLLRIVTQLSRGGSRGFWALLLQNIALHSRPSVDVLQADDVVLVERAKGYLKDPHRSFASGRKAVHCRAGDKDPFPTLRPDDCVP
jgi:hypothetical protein